MAAPNEPIGATTKLYVGNLSWGVSTDILRDTFSKHGTVMEAYVATDKENGRSRGFGFVTFEKVEDSERARESLNGFDLEGRTIRIEFATSKNDRAPREHGSFPPRRDRDFDDHRAPRDNYGSRDERPRDDRVRDSFRGGASGPRDSDRRHDIPSRDRYDDRRPSPPRGGYVNDRRPSPPRNYDRRPDDFRGSSSVPPARSYDDRRDFGMKNTFPAAVISDRAPRDDMRRDDRGRDDYRSAPPRDDFRAPPRYDDRNGSADYRRDIRNDGPSRGGREEFRGRDDRAPPSRDDRGYSGARRPY